jgi:hypothetical protein
MGPEELAGLLKTASPLLRAHFGQEITLHSPGLVKDGIRCCVVRCEVTGPGSRPRSVIVKQIKPDREAARGFTDWASLAFLSGLDGSGEAPRGAGLPPGEGSQPHTVSATRSVVRGGAFTEQKLGATRHSDGLAPRFLGGDPGAGVYVIEDLGGSLTLDDLLNGRDPSALWDAMRRLAVQAARLNGVTGGCESDFLRIRAALPGAECVDRRRDAKQWLAGRPRLHAWFEAVTCPVPEGFDVALAHVARAYAEPGPFLAFTHGDFAPSNNHVAGKEIRLLDFEYGGFRHAFYDITAWNVLCPLPEPLVDEISCWYRAELVRTFPAARDDGSYREAWALLSTYRALAMLIWIPPAILEANRPWVGDWSAREAVLAALGRLIRSAAGQAELEPTTEGVRGLETRLRARWPEYGEVLPAWPALQALEHDEL